MIDQGSQVKQAADGLRITSDHHVDRTSQCGEDGVVQAIFAHLQIAEGTAVEFGAWDGEHYSNTHSLIEHGWRVVFIEGDPARFEALRTKMARFDRVLPIEAWVRARGDSSLDAILDRVRISEVDLLSVDIDGDDYHVLAALRRSPKIVCVEFNPTIPPPILFVGAEGRAEGSSLVAFYELMRSRSYSLVHATKLNAFFVRGDLASRFTPVSPAECFNYRSSRFVIGFFDGRNRIVDFRGKPAKARNQWSKARAAITLNAPLHKLLAAAGIVVVGAAVALWIALDRAGEPRGEAPAVSTTSS